MELWVEEKSAVKGDLERQNPARKTRVMSDESWSVMAHPSEPPISPIVDFPSPSSFSDFFNLLFLI